MLRLRSRFGFLSLLLLVLGLLPVLALEAQPVVTFGISGISVELGDTAVLGNPTVTGQAPFTYQWVEQGANNSIVPLHDGATPNGSTLSGTNWTTVNIRSITPADAGAYALQVTDANGYSTTSAWLSVSVKAAAPPTITLQPSDRTVVAGNNTYLFFTATGSYPRTYQWYKGAVGSGTAIAGATSAVLNLYAVQVSDAGSYYVVVSNPYGSATSTAATLTVTPATPITFGTVSPVTVTVGQTAYLSAYVQSGSAPITYQWQKNGVAITGATSNYYSFATTSTADSGSYTLVATNAAGAVTSPTLTLTVNPPVPPTIATQPNAVSVAQGNSASFSVSVNGSYPMTYQWMKNGTAISGATYGSYGIAAVQPSDAGSYSVTVTNAGGSVTSAAATLTVLPPVLPTFYAQGSAQSVTVGANLALSVPSMSNNAVGPFTYQWYKNGSAIAGATASSYSVAAAQLTDAGSYVVAVTNTAGTVNAPVIEVTITPAVPAGTAWLDAVQQGNVVYFLYSSHLERYDLAGGTWLASTSLSQTATAICAASDGIYVGFGRALAKFPLDLSSQTTLANLGDSISGMFSYGSFVFVYTGTSYSGSAYPVDRNTGVVGTAASMSLNNSPSFAVATAAGKVVTPDYVWAGRGYKIGATGTLTADGLQYPYTFPYGTRAYVFPDGTHFGDNGGTVWNVSDGTVAATFGGTFTDMTFLDDGSPIVLRTNRLYRYTGSTLVESAHTALGVTGTRIFAAGQNVVVFYPGTSAGNSYIGLTNVATTSLASTYPTAPAADATSVTFTPDAVVQDSAGGLYLYDAARENIYRWSPTTRSYAAPVQLGGSPVRLVYSATLNRIYCIYRGGKITQVQLGVTNPTEQAFASFPIAPIAVATADNYLFASVQHAPDSGQSQVVLDANGQITTLTGTGYYAASYTWSSANQALYGAGGSVQRLQSNGTFSSQYSASLAQSPSGTIFPSPDGSRLLAASGQVYDASGLYLGIIGNAVTDVAWIGNTPYTLRANSTGSEAQAWSSTNFILAASAALPGRPLRLLPFGSNQLLLVSQSGSTPTYTILNATLQRVSSTATDTSSGIPTFLAQPAPSLTVFSGTSVTLAVDTAGTQPQTFQWSKNGTPIAGATTAAFTIGAIGTGDAGNYAVTATNSAGSATSGTTNISVAAALAFTAQPQSQIVTYGGAATFTATVANTTGASFQWFFNGTALSGATSNTLVVSPAYSSNFGTYVLKVSNAAGSIYSNPATLAQDTKPVISTQPQSVTVSAGATASFYVYGSNATSYQWYFNGTAIAGQTSSTLYVNNATAANAGSYTVVLTSAGGSTTSTAATLTVLGTGPVITDPPHSFTATAGNSATFSVSATNVTSYQWYFNGTPIAGATSGIYAIPVVTLASAGSYTVVLTGPGGTTTSPAALLSVSVPGPYRPGAYFGTFAAGGRWGMWVSSSGLANMVGTLPQNKGAFIATFAVNSSGALQMTSSSGWAAANSGVSLPSTITGSISVGVTGDAGGDAGAFTGTYDSGSTVNTVGYYTASALNDAMGQSYAVIGNSGQALVIWVNFQGVGTAPDSATGTMNAQGQMSATTALGRAMTASVDRANVVLSETLTPPGGTAVSFGGLSSFIPNTARLMNLSSRANVGTGADVLVTGFSIVGTAPKNILVRGVGPGLATFGLTDALSAPVLTLNDAKSNSLWSGAAWGGGTDLSRMFTQVGAFPLATSSADCAHIFQEGTGGYSAVIAGANGATGVALAEVYDGDGSTTASRLVNLSARANVGAGSGVLTAGLVVGGGGPETVLLRGIGPTLKSFGLSNALAAPKLTLYDGTGNVLAVNTGWTDPQGMISFTSAKVSAFALAPNSGDAVLLVTLMPGNYSVQVSSQNDTTGVALVEVYEVK